MTASTIKLELGTLVALTDVRMVAITITIRREIARRTLNIRDVKMIVIVLQTVALPTPTIVLKGTIKLVTPLSMFSPPAYPRPRGTAVISE